MTFSRRYKNTSSVKKDDKPQTQKGFDLHPSSHHDEDHDETFHESRFSRFKQGSSQQASRLVITNHPNKSKLTLPWGFYLKLILVICIITGLVTTWLHRDQWVFPIKRVELQGHFSRVPGNDIQAILSQYAKGSLLLLHEHQLQTQLQNLPWMNQVNIKRQWPTTLIIQLEQKNIVARFGNSRLLDAQGQIFIPPQMVELNTLPYIDGPDSRAPQLWQAYVTLNNILKPIHLTITKLEVSPRLSYTLTLSNGIILYLGADDVINRLTIFVKVYTKTLASRADAVQYADMRYDSGMAVAWKQQPASTISKNSSKIKSG